MSSASKVTDHDEIRRWTEEHGGKLALVEGTENAGSSDSMLRLDFGRDDDWLKPIDWEEWLKVFGESKPALLINEDKDESRFNKLVSRD